jgi:hypothetical protein
MLGWRSCSMPARGRCCGASTRSRQWQGCAFACSPFPFERVQPTCVEFDRDGHFHLLDGGPYPATSNPAIALETDDPRAAIDEAIRRFVGC